MAAGMAKAGWKPVVAIYSTFLQRSFDQLIHDVCLQNLPVTICVDRAGLVGDDGKTHHGIFDITYTRTLPNMIVAAPKDENELQHLLFTAIESGGPFAIRYPRGLGAGRRARPVAEEDPDRQRRDPPRGQRPLPAGLRLDGVGGSGRRGRAQGARDRVRRRQRPVRQAARPGAARADRGHGAAHPDPRGAPPDGRVRKRRPRGVPRGGSSGREAEGPRDPDQFVEHSPQAIQRREPEARRGGRRRDGPRPLS